MKSIDIRAIDEHDSAVISQAFADQGWHKPVSQYQRYVRESRDGTRAVLIAERDGQFAGYLTIEWTSHYPPFQAEQIPEIVDFNVLQRFQRQGIGSALLDRAEQLIATRSAIAGIGVGLFADYGAAQRLYVKRGYVPDGRGIAQNGRHLRYGDRPMVDDDLALFLTKQLA